jgi:hypothetical protein
MVEDIKYQSRVAMKEEENASQEKNCDYDVGKQIFLLKIHLRTQAQEVSRGLFLLRMIEFLLFNALFSVVRDDK